MDGAVARLKRCPNPIAGLSEIEIRPLFDVVNYAEDMTPEFKEIRGRVREKLSGTLGPIGGRELGLVTGGRRLATRPHFPETLVQ